MLVDRTGAIQPLFVDYDQGYYAFLHENKLMNLGTILQPK